MAKIMERKLIRVWGCSQLVLGVLVLLSLMLSIGTIVVLLQVRSQTQVAMRQLATDLTILSEYQFEYTVHFSETVPIQTVIALHENFAVPINLVISQTIPINTNIPFQFPLSTTPLEIPIAVDVPVNVPIQTEVNVPLNYTIPISTEVPLVIDIPLKIEVSKTPLKGYLLNLAKMLREMSP